MSIPGRRGSEFGCPDSPADDPTNPGDWDPGCDQAQLTLDTSDDIWKATKAPPSPTTPSRRRSTGRGTRTTDSAPCAAARTSATSAPGGDVRFYYDHRTHWVTNDVISDIVVATGTFQDEMGCPADNAIGCMRGWMQVPDGDGVYSLWTTEVPPAPMTSRRR